jgi:hypothetical protein
MGGIEKPLKLAVGQWVAAPARVCRKRYLQQILPRRDKLRLCGGADLYGADLYIEDVCWAAWCWRKCVT